MKALRNITLTLTVLGAFGALAAEPDPSTLYELSTEGSTTSLAAGGQGTFVLSIRSKEGAHVSDEAPLKLELSGRNVTVAKSKLTYADSVAKKAEGQKWVDPRFEVPISATSAGKGSVDGKLTFFICTDKICARQQKTISVPVEVN